jgi:hypothetical protein
MTAVLMNPKQKLAMVTQANQGIEQENDDAAQGTTLVSVSGMQARFERLIADLAAKGIKVYDGDLSKLQTVGLTEGQAKDILNAVSKAESAAEGQLILADFAKASEETIKLAGKIFGGDDVSRSALFVEISNGLAGFRSPAKILETLTQGFSSAKA